MMSEKEPLKITLEDLAPDTQTDTAVQAAEKVGGKLRENAGQVGQKLADAVKDSTAKVTQRIADSAADAASRSTEAVRDRVAETLQAQSKATADAVEQRLREIDWKAEAQKGAEGTLRWLSDRLEQAAERLKKEAASGGADGPTPEKDSK